MADQSSVPPRSRQIASPIILLMISAAHLAYGPLIDLRAMPMLVPALVVSASLGLAYAYSAWRARRGRGYRTAVNLIVGEDIGVLAVGVLLGYPWAEYFRPATLIIIPLQLALAFAEIVRRQDSGQPIVAGSRLAWFVVAYALAFAIYALAKPAGLLQPDVGLPV